MENSLIRLFNGAHGTWGLQIVDGWFLIIVPKFLRIFLVFHCEHWKTQFPVLDYEFENGGISVAHPGLSGKLL